MDKQPGTAETASASIDKIVITVAERLKSARKKLGLTQRQVAARAGLTYSYVYEIETGRVNITLRSLAALAEALEIDIRTLFPGMDLVVSPVLVADEALLAFLAKTRAMLEDYERQDADREKQHAHRHRRQIELLSELSSVMASLITVDTTEPLVQEAEKAQAAIAEPKGKVDGRAGKDRPTKSH